jgi:hypothetical protein
MMSLNDIIISHPARQQVFLMTYFYIIISKLCFNDSFFWRTSHIPRKNLAIDPDPSFRLPYPQQVWGLKQCHGLLKHGGTH